METFKASHFYVGYALEIDCRRPPLFHHTYFESKTTTAFLRLIEIFVFIR